MSASEIIQLIRGYRFGLGDEKRLQEDLFGVLQARFPETRREVRLSPGNIIDFMIGAIGIEVKIKGQRLAIYRQCERYCEHNDVAELILLSNAAMGFPPEIKGKPTYLVSLSKSWL
jgi:hypothetical protein